MSASSPAVSGDLRFFEAVQVLPGDIDDWDVVDTLRCKRCGSLIRAGLGANLSDLNESAEEHSCLKAPR
ncbi:hypothetical protein ABZW18_34590 [Streptomyces sp. NPDC004647]|uniref:hypothetical protein n=1 Tax=Streptomyces sp. NPDC004647 TaxID=3154671 RepID=UPI0033A292E7